MFKTWTVGTSRVSTELRLPNQKYDLFARVYLHAAFGIGGGGGIQAQQKGYSTPYTILPPHGARAPSGPGPAHYRGFTITHI